MTDTVLSHFLLLGHDAAKQGEQARKRFHSKAYGNIVPSLQAMAAHIAAERAADWRLSNQLPAALIAFIASQPWYYCPESQADQRRRLFQLNEALVETCGLPPSTIVLVLSPSPSRKQMLHRVANSVASSLRSGASANAPCRLSPLHAAAAFGNMAATSVLIGAGANVNAVDEQGNTPLHICAATAHCWLLNNDEVFGHDHHVVASLLVRHGADANARNSHGCRPADLDTGNFIWRALCPARFAPIDLPLWECYRVRTPFPPNPPYERQYWPWHQQPLSIPLSIPLTVDSSFAPKQTMPTAPCVWFSGDSFVALAPTQLATGQEAVSIWHWSEGQSGAAVVAAEASLLATMLRASGIPVTVFSTPSPFSLQAEPLRRRISPPEHIKSVPPVERSNAIEQLAILRARRDDLFASTWEEPWKEPAYEHPSVQWFAEWHAARREHKQLPIDPSPDDVHDDVCFCGPGEQCKWCGYAPLQCLAEDHAMVCVKRYAAPDSRASSNWRRSLHESGILRPEEAGIPPDPTNVFHCLQCGDDDHGMQCPALPQRCEFGCPKMVLPALQQRRTIPHSAEHGVHSEAGRAEDQCFWGLRPAFASVADDQVPVDEVHQVCVEAMAKLRADGFAARLEKVLCVMH